HRKGDATIEVVGKDGKSLANATVEVRQQTHEFLFGCNLFVLDQLPTPELNAKYERAFTNLFNFATLPFYWRDLEPEQGKHRFAENSPRIWRRPPPGRLVKWCKANGITPKGHALMYAKNKFMPDWTARNDAETFRLQSAKHMAEIAARYKRDIPIWDAVNEEIPRLKHLSEWHAVQGDFLAWCFKEAGRLFPQQTRLLINDGTHEAHDTTSEYEAMVKGLLRQGVRVEGVGIQFHAYNRGAMLSGKLFPPEKLSAAYEQLGRLGLPLYMTEITIPGTGENGAELQAAVVANLYRLWFSTPAMAGVTWWNLGDDTAYENENKALGGLLDNEMNPKPAYEALDKLINHDWETRLTLKTDASGKASFRGFCGTYGYTAEVSGKKSAGVFRLQRGMKNPVTIKP
ncbi:MAG: endo-1,4-beta-xylanase, partial [Verrucomicrobia bacterium]|nr:endo-1,4-beta-xylanase [Verrucomicrobiota bacterium]